MRSLEVQEKVQRLKKKVSRRAKTSKTKKNAMSQLVEALGLEWHLILDYMTDTGTKPPTLKRRMTASRSKSLAQITTPTKH